jgi:hypothetical protein
MKRIAYAVVALALVAFEVYRHVPISAAASGPLAAVLVEESSKRSPQLGTAATSPAVLKTIAEKHIDWAFVDQDVTGANVADIQWALDEAKKWSKPVLITRRGAKIEHTPPPGTAEALAALLKSKAS